MLIKRFNKTEDYERVIGFLTEQYKHNKNMSCWLPQRFDDLIFRIDTLYKIERGKEASQDYIYIFEEDNEIVGLILPDADSCNTSIKEGYEHIFSEIVLVLFSCQQHYDKIIFFPFAYAIPQSSNIQ